MKDNPSIQTHTLSEVEDELIGKKGTPERNQYEYELQLETLRRLIRQIRKERNLTQEELGKLVGVKKATISKLERRAGNMTIDTLLRIFTALKADVSLKIEIDHEKEVKIA